MALFRKIAWRQKFLTPRFRGVEKVCLRQTSERLRFILMKNHKTLIAFLLLTGIGTVISLLLDRTDSSETRPGPTGTPRRIICMSPAVTELVFALGCGEHVVGVSDFCTWPTDASKKDKIGGVFNPNLEKLLVLAPDLIIIQGRCEKVTQFCRKKNISLLQVEVSDIKTIYNDLNLLGRRLGRADQAARLCTEIRQALWEIKVKAAKHRKQRVFFSLGRTSGSLIGLTTVGGKTFLSELINIAGGDNIFADIGQPYPRISKEALLKRAPEIIIEAHPGLALNHEEQQRLTRDWQAFASLPAVQNGQIRFLTEEYLLIPGPRICQTARLLARCIHPEVFGD